MVHPGLSAEAKQGIVLTWTRELIAVEADFTDIKLPSAGEYIIYFEASTVPEAPADHLPERVTSDLFTINAPQFTRFIVTYEVDFDAIINGNETQFVAVFEATFVSRYPGAELYNTTIHRGSLIVSTFVTARTASQLVDIINQATSDPNTTLTLLFNGTTLVPSTVVQDPAYPVSLEDHLVLILATTIPAGVILLCGLLLICVVCLCQRKRRAKQQFGIQVVQLNSSPHYPMPFLQAW